MKLAGALLIAAAVGGCGTDNTRTDAGTCNGACTVGATRCSGAQVQTCVTGADGCAGWGSPAACPPQTTCTQDHCTPLSSPDLAEAPDLAEGPDLTQTPDMLETPDLAMKMPDLGMPDLGMPDLEMPDLEMPDLAVGPDLRSPPDLVALPPATVFDFVAARGVGPIGDPVATVGGDFDNDGKLDLAVAHNLPFAVTVLLGNGDGTFKKAVDYPLGVSPFSLAAVDINNDGKLDLALATENFASKGVSILLGNGDGTFKAEQTWSTKRSAQSGLAIADFDKDGKLDVALCIQQLAQSTDNVAFLHGNGDGTFAAPTTLPTTGLPSLIATADWNGDGSPDLLVGEQSLWMYLGNGNGTFQAAVKYTPAHTPYALEVGDVDGDKKPDVAVMLSDYSVTLYLGPGDGTLKTGANYPFGYLANDIAFGDFNGDNKIDLAVNRQISGPTGVEVRPGNGDGTFGAMTTFDGGAGPKALAVGDWNGDAKLDVASAVGPDIFLLRGRSDGTFIVAGQVATPDDTEYALAAGDWNGDGWPDVAVTGGNQNILFALLGKGDGTFQTAASVNVGVRPVGIASGDWNSDGKLDAVTANLTDGTLTLVRGQGDGTFQFVNALNSGFKPDAVVAADFNGDGHADIVAANNGDDNVAVFLAFPQGGFKAPVKYATAAAPSDLSVGDWNGDGKLDVAAGCATGNALSFLAGVGDGTFKAHVDTAVTAPISLAAGDFDRNGNLDLATVDYANNQINVLLGKGDGTFTVGTPIVAQKGPSRVVASDFDTDGKLDLAVGHQFGDAIRILRGNGDGTFRSPDDFAPGVGTWPPLPLVGDWNGDGRPDLCVGAGVRSVGVMINASK